MLDVQGALEGMQRLHEVAEVVRSEYASAGDLFGLRRYLISLNKLSNLNHQNGELQVFPAGQLIVNDDSADRTLLEIPPRYRSKKCD